MIAKRDSLESFSGLQTESIAYETVAYETVAYEAFAYKTVAYKTAAYKLDLFSFQRSLTLDCKEGQPGIIQWTPDRDTPDLVYYQCYTHRYLGWKIHVVDSCDQ